MYLAHSEINEWGVARQFFIDELSGEITVSETQNVEPILEMNKLKANGNGKTITSEVCNPVASIPMGVILKWFREEGFWVYDADKDPEAQKKLNAKLNDSEWRYLRTSELII